MMPNFEYIPTENKKIYHGWVEISKRIECLKIISQKKIYKRDIEEFNNIYNSIITDLEQLRQHTENFMINELNKEK